MRTEPLPVDPLLRTGLPDRPQLGVAAIARRLGIAPATLRTWDRRYGIGPTDHTPGRHRRYSPEDVARLELMQHALVRGATPVDAAHYATRAELSEPAFEQNPPPTVDDQDANDDGPTETHIRAGGTALRLAGAGRRAHGLARAALSMDPAAMRELLTESLLDGGVESTWDGVVRPVLGAVAERWEHTGSGVEVEHLISECVTGVFGAYAAMASTDGEARPVLLAGMPGEQHIMPLVALSAALACRGVQCRPLGANLPFDALVAAIRRTAPSVVVLWAQVGESADVEALRSLPRTRPLFRTFVAGPGWSDCPLPPRISWLNSLVEARSAIGDAVAVRRPAGAASGVRPTG